MKKLIVCISLLLAMTMAAVACTDDSQNENNTSSSTTTNKEEGTTIADEDPTTSTDETTSNDETTVNDETTADDQTTEGDVTTEIKEEETTETKDPEPELPSGCLFYVSPEKLAQRVTEGKANNTTAELKDGYVTLTSTGDDPYVYLMDNGANLDLSWYFMIIVRLPSNAADNKYSVFVGNDPAPSPESVYNLTYGEDCIGKWNCLNIGIRPLVGDNLNIGNCRYDYYDTNGGSIDIVGAYFFADENSWTAFANSQNYILNN